MFPSPISPAKLKDARKDLSLAAKHIKATQSKLEPTQPTTPLSRNSPPAFIPQQPKANLTHPHRTTIVHETLHYIVESVLSARGHASMARELVVSMRLAVAGGGGGGGGARGSVKRFRRGFPSFLSFSFLFFSALSCFLGRGERRKGVGWGGLVDVIFACSSGQGDRATVVKAWGRESHVHASSRTETRWAGDGGFFGDAVPQQTSTVMR